MWSFTWVWDRYQPPLHLVSKSQRQHHTAQPEGQHDQQQNFLNKMPRVHSPWLHDC